MDQAFCPYCGDYGGDPMSAADLAYHLANDHGFSTEEIATMLPRTASVATAPITDGENWNRVADELGAD